MANLPQLTRLFAQLALDLRRSTASSSTTAAISALSTSLNSKTPNSRVLDAALALMCFKTPQAIDARIECTVRTIVAVLSSMASCCVSDGLGLVRVGSLMTVEDCDEVVRIGADLLENLEGRGGLSDSLFYAILRAGVSSSSCQIVLPSSPVLIEEEERERTNANRRTAISKLMHYLPNEIYFRNNEVPLRLLLWYLDPSVLKHDVSEILRETTKRPFICLKEELHARMTWRSIIICLVTSPTMFAEARALLHNWFLLTGLESILKFQTTLISSVLDVLSRPMWWGVSMEMGLKFPFSHAYFPNTHRELLSILNGPISCEGFLDLVRHIQLADYSDKKVIDTSHRNFRHGATVNAVDNNSTWSMLMQFPAWFYFAIILVFSGEDTKDSCLSRVIYSTPEPNTETVKVVQKAASVYLSWVVNPLDETCFDQCANCIQEISRLWSTRNRSNYKKESLKTHEKNTYKRSKILTVPKANDHEANQVEDGKGGALAIGEWLKQFDGYLVSVCGKNKTKVPVEAKDRQNGNLQSSVLFLRIPLGILITSNYLDEKECELLLHYATTGETLRLGEMKRMRALDGACLVFNLFDILEDMSVSLFDLEDTETNFFCQMKVKACSYLLRCLKALTEDVIGEADMVDLYKRLKKLKEKGGEVFEGCNAFDDVVDDFGRKLTNTKDN